jgi:hypothetical protein
VGNRQPHTEDEDKTNNGVDFCFQCVKWVKLKFKKSKFFYIYIVFIYAETKYMKAFTHFKMTNRYVKWLMDFINTLGTSDADLRFYRVLQSFGSFVTISRRVTQICVFTRGWIPRNLHLITQYLEPFFE